MAKRKQNAKRNATSNAQVSALVKSVKQLAVKPKKAKPFRDTGGIIGNRIGGMFGSSSIGRGVGRWLGTGIGSIFGSGDYRMVGNSPSYNVLTNGSQIPHFQTGRQTNIVCHREYLRDIVGTTGFSLNTFSLNPGMSDTFPWLATVSTSYQEYKFHGLVFEFRSLITDFVTSGAPGVVVMATNYNADAPVYSSKQQMENSEFAVATKPTLNLMHGIECADNQTILPQRYIRSGSVPTGQDLRLYDLGNFQFATASNPAQTLGELWVSYCVEFFKPIQPSTEVSPGSGFHASRTSISAANPLGLTQLTVSGTLSVSTGFNFVTIRNAEAGVNYKIDVIWYGVAVVASIASPNFISCTGVNRFSTNTNSSVNVPIPAASSTTASFSTIVVSTLVSPGDITFFLSGGGTYPTTAVDIFVTQLDPSITQ
jgi:hypothetical protein